MAFFKQTISTVPLHGQTVLLRADYNVPLNKDGTIADDFRIRASLPTVKRLLGYGCKVVIISHLGRPKGKKDPSLSLEPAAQRLAELLGEPIRFVDQTIGDKVHMAIKRAPKRSVIVLENLRFDPREETDDPVFAKALARDTGARYFVQDGFGVVHRAHASTHAITMQLPSVAGLLVEREYTAITRTMKHPEHPFVAVMGGAKVADKIDVIKRLIPVADTIAIGGAMANTFLAYKGYSIGKSVYEPNETATLDEIYKEARKKAGDTVDEFIVLPTDVVVGKDISTGDHGKNVLVDAIGTDEYALDVGRVSSQKIVALVSQAKTVVWNGTLGYAEIPAFAKASAGLAGALANRADITSVIGGGDTADFVLHWDKKHGESFTHVSTGGGASLDLMSGKKLPGVESLLDASK